mmetsp:Transcript_7447/g.9772  ORF Transcript_7447/g.9772 Transcript_7447/m.9772 type:complete len:516 (+) Transcript_7447:47-1594(+)
MKMELESTSKDGDDVNREGFGENVIVEDVIDSVGLRLGVVPVAVRAQELGLRVLDSISRTYKHLLAALLKNAAYIGLDMQMEVDAMGEDFVQSDTFLKYTNNVFDECDVDGNGYLHGGEFYAAVLLLYHQLNKIPFSGRKTPPAREFIMRMFDEYSLLQQQETLMEQIEIRKDKSKKALENSKKFLFGRQLSFHFERAGLGNHANGSHGFFSNLFPQLLFGGLLLSIYEFIRNQQHRVDLWICGSDRSICQQFDPSTINRTIAASLAVITCVTIFSLMGLNLTSAAHIHERLNDMDRNKQSEGAGKGSALVKGQTRPDNTPALNREYFIELCQDHFQNLVASEGWRLLAHAVLVPVVAIRLKGLIFAIPLVRKSFAKQKYFSEDIVAGVLITLILTLFPFIEPVVVRLMWGNYVDEKKSKREKKKRRSRKRRHVPNEDHVPADVKKKEKNKRKDKRRREIRRSVNRMVGMNVYNSQADLGTLSRPPAKDLMENNTRSDNESESQIDESPIPKKII